ncbi:MMPL family transporter [Nocardioides cavernaquae]|nr:MMPL family transporter [Nocardioides cavernaquae]
MVGHQCPAIADAPSYGLNEEHPMDHEPSRWMSQLASFCVGRPVRVLLACLALVGLVNLLVPQLEQVVAQDSTPIVPKQAPAVQALGKMDREFGNGKSVGIVFVVLERDGGLTAADDRFFKELLPRLRDDTENVSFVQNVTSKPEILAAVTSKDKEAVYVQVGLPGDIGAPSALGQIEAVRDITREERPDGLNVAVTGPAATIADMSTEVEHSILKITFVTVGLIALILMLIYRSVVVTALILGFIGVALAAARGTAALLGGHAFEVSTFTASFLTAVVLGAATDYAIFMVSRFQEQRRLGMPAREAAAVASSRVSSVIIGSALTVVLANACMALADVGIYLTTGPAIAVGIVVTLALSLTWMPAMIGLAGARGWLDPRARPAAATGWQRLADMVVSRPGRVLVAGLLPLVLLAVFYPAMKPSFDERVVQPDDTESNVGYALLEAHFPLNETLPDYILVSADRDLRNARDLAALEQMSAAVARTPGVVSVRGVTRPLGTTITEASLGYQAGEVGSRLTGAGEEVRAGEKGAHRLAEGAGELSTGAGQVASGADQAVAGAGRLLAGVRELQSGVTRLSDGSGEALAGTGQLRAGAARLADGLDSAYDQTTVAVNGLAAAYDALRRSLTCGIDPYCSGARDGIRQIYEGERDRLLPGLRQAADAARRIENGTVDLQTGLAQIDAGLTRAEEGADQLAAGSRTMESKLGELADGAEQVADGSRQVEGGTEEMAQSVTELRSGLEQAAAYLNETGKAAKDPAIGGFYLPPAAMTDSRFALASGLFLSPDGHTARMVVLGDTDAFDRSATERALEVREAAHQGLRGTPLEGSEVATTGIATIMADLEEFNTADFRLIALVALLGVFLILLVLLRSVVAAGFLLASVCLSYAAAMGLGTLVWQIGMDRPMDWSVPTIAFILLVAVGADYNLLLMKRMLEEAPDGSRAGIARAVTATGGVITAAGVIFAASLFAMMSGSVLTLSQIGFTIGVGLLLDTFVVRTLVVPAGAALLGPRLWWPRANTQGAHS